MSLRLQLLAFVALTLFLPWAGLELVIAMEESLRNGLERQLQRSAGAVAQVVAGSGAFELASTPPAGLAPPLYLHPLSRQPRLDANLSDWQFTRDRSAEAPGLARELEDGSRLWLGIHSIFVYLYVEVIDADIVAQGEPGSPPHGDRLVLVLGRDAASRKVLLLPSPATAGAGAVPLRGQRSVDAVEFRSSGAYEDLVRGAYRRTGTGFAIEAFLPLSLVDGALGVGIVDSYAGGAGADLVARTWADGGVPNALAGERPDLAGVIADFAGGTERYRIFDGDGWILADSGPPELAPTIEAQASPTLVEQFFRSILRREHPAYSELLAEPGRIGDPVLLAALRGLRSANWYRPGADASAVVVAAVPVDPDNPGRGAVMIEEVNDPILTLTNAAMLNLVTTTVLVSFVAALALLAYSSWLSLRIRRLARAAESALGPRGEIRTALPGARAGDEIGDLSRSFGDLLGRLRDYTDYLQSLKSKLSHELRTPLAIVATSVDNLEHETASATGRAYLARLRQGAERLESVLQAMTAATRVEQAITQTELETFDLVAVVGSCVSAYGDIYPGQAFDLSLPETAIAVEGSPDLIAQALDKLVDNAASFAVEGTAIEVSVSPEGAQLRLAVVNRGPLLPAAMRHQLFDSLVSVREQGDDKPHLGLGLYIVTLVAEFHGGRVEADNLEDGSGVRISLVLPRRDPGAA